MPMSNNTEEPKPEGGSESPASKRPRPKAPEDDLNVAQHRASPVPAENYTTQSNSGQSHAVPIAGGSSQPAVWNEGTSPVDSIPFDDLIKMHDSLEKMAIIHEIAINPNFKVEDLRRGDALYETVKSTMQKAYWDALREELAKNPEEFHQKQALQMLADLHTMTKELLSAENLKKVAATIDELLDLEHLHSMQQKKALDLREVLHAVLLVLGHLCAPVRDDLVKRLTQEQDIIELFSGLFELVEKMRIDMANFTVGTARGFIESYSERIEREQFDKIAEMDKDALRFTTLRLKSLLEEYLAHGREQQVSVSSTSAAPTELSRAEVSELIVSFYMSVLLENSGDRPRPGDLHFPETLALDEQRLAALGEKLLQLILTAGAIFVTTNLAGRELAPEARSGFKTRLKNELIPLLNDVSVGNQRERLEAVALHCEKHSRGVWKAECEQKAPLLREQICALASADDRIRSIARDRVCAFIRAALKRTNQRLEVPPGLNVLQSEMAALTSRIYSIVVHNWKTFGTLYGQILDEAYAKCK